MLIVAIDILTTGIDPFRNQILEFGCVCGDFSWGTLVSNQNLSMNLKNFKIVKPILDRLAFGNENTVQSHRLKLEFDSFLNEIRGKLGLGSGNYHWNLLMSSQIKLKMLAGLFGSGGVGELLVSNENQFRSRMIDFPYRWIRNSDPGLPSLSDCLERAGLVDGNNCVERAKNLLRLAQL